MVAIIDYKMGNLHSVQKACARVGLRAKLVTRAEEIPKAKAVVLPGVGAFGQAMQHLRSQGLIRALKNFAFSGKPFLGICLGMQLLFEESKEFGINKGLGILTGKVIPFSKNIKVPHMGWNTLNILKRHPFLRGIKNHSYMYFVHSFYCVPNKRELLLATTEYNKDVAAMVGKDNIFAMQFHPEKSQDVGLKIYENLARYLQAK